MYCLSPSRILFKDTAIFPTPGGTYHQTSFKKNNRHKIACSCLRCKIFVGHYLADLVEVRIDNRV